MTIELDPATRSTMTKRFAALQKVRVEQVKTKRSAKPSPQAWAYSYAGKPREFIGELIDDWQNDNWVAWRAFTSAVFAQPFQSDEELQIFRECTDLEDPPGKRPPSVWLPTGRRGGKSRMLAVIAVYLGCCYDWKPFLVGGEVGVIPVLAADRRQARTIMGYVKSFLEHPQLAGLVTHESAESINLRGNVLIEVVTASYRAVRSRTVVAALADETAFWMNADDSLNPDREIIAALEPAMATIPNALLLVASSPYCRRGVLWDAFEKWYGKPDGPLVWKAPTWVMNPTVPQAFLDEKYAEDPQAAAAEYGAEFRRDIDEFISKEILETVIHRDIHEWPPRPGFTYTAFVDPSGGSTDSMTLAIGHVDRQTKRGVLDAIRERRPDFSPEAVVKEFADLLRLYRVTKVEGDHYGGEWPRERFRLNGIGYVVADKRKSDIYLEFLPLINANRIELLDNKRMYNQFLGLERRSSRGGHETVDHQKGAQDDVANVVAGLMVRLLGKRDMLNIDPAVLMRSTRIRTKHSLDDLTQGPVWR